MAVAETKGNSNGGDTATQRTSGTPKKCGAEVSLTPGLSLCHLPAPQHIQIIW